MCCAFPALVALMALNLQENRNEVLESRNIMSDFKQIGGVLMSPKIRNLLGIVMVLIMCPSIGSVFNFFLTERLHFRPQTMGEISFISSAAYLIGIQSLNTVFRAIPFKKFYIITTFMMTLCWLASLLLVERWNKYLGVSDEFFCLSNQALVNFLSELNFQPILGLGCRLCPPGLEGTTYSVFTAIFNTAFYFSTLFGSILTYVYGVTSKNFDNLSKLIIIQTIYSCLFGLLLFVIKFPDSYDHNELTDEDANCVLNSDKKEYKPLSNTYSVAKQPISNHIISEIRSQIVSQFDKSGNKSIPSFSPQKIN